MSGEMKFFIVYILLSIILSAHDGSYEMNYENFIANNQGFSTQEKVLTAKVIKKENYSEVLFYDEEGAKANFEFNNHYSNYTSDDPNDLNHYSISTWGWYNTISYKSGDIAYLWHGKPVMSRHNEGLGEIEKKFFENIITTGKFEYLVEKNWSQLYVKPEEFSSLPAKDRVFRVIIKVVNPDAFIDFMVVD